MTQIKGVGMQQAIKELQKNTNKTALETSNRNAEKIINAIDSGEAKTKNPTHLGKKIDIKI